MSMIKIELTRERASWLRGYLFGQTAILKGEYFTIDLEAIQSIIEKALKETEP